MFTSPALSRAVQFVDARATNPTDRRWPHAVMLSVAGAISITLWIGIVQVAILLLKLL